MLAGAKRRLDPSNVRYILGDYAKIQTHQKYDIAVSVIGIHHQTHQGKRKLFRKIYKMLKPGGVFIFGDLVTYSDKHQAAIAQAHHYHHLVKYAYDAVALNEWAYHHMFLNMPAPIEDQIRWLKDAGFHVEKKFLRWNTALLICKK